MQGPVALPSRCHESRVVLAEISGCSGSDGRGEHMTSLIRRDKRHPRSQQPQAQQAQAAIRLQSTAFELDLFCP